MADRVGNNGNNGSSGLNGQAGRDGRDRGPDPTTLTTDQLEREIKHLRELIEARLDQMDTALVEARNTTEKAVEAARITSQTAVSAAIDAAKCVSADTPILCADLIWRPAGSLLVGEEIVGFDANTPPGVGHGRTLKKAIVTANSLHTDRLISVETSEGTVRCNAAHPWLARPRSKPPWQWVMAEDLCVGDEVSHPFDVWEIDESREGGWLQGIFDGEGCLCFKNGNQGQARLSVNQCVGPTRDKIYDALKSRVDVVTVVEKAATARHRAKTEFQIDIRPNIAKLLGSVRPERLLEKSNSVWEGFSLLGNRRTAMITDISDAGEGTIASLSTSTHTYIAAGFAMHNTAIVEFDSSISRRLGAAAELNEAKFSLLRDVIASNREKTLDEFQAEKETTEAKFDGVSKEFVTFRTLLDANAAQAALALTSADKAVNAAFVSSKEAISKAEVFNEKRFDIITKQLDELKASQDQSYGKAQAVPNSDTQIQRLADEVRALRDYREASQGQSKGMSLSVGWIVSGIGLLATIVVIVNVIIALATR